MRWPDRSFVRRLLLSGFIVGVAAGGLWLLGLRLAMAQWRASQISYHAGSEADYADIDRRLRAAIARLRADDPGREGEPAIADEIFNLLRVSATASDSRQVEMWRRASHSPERRGVALRWAVTTADEAAFHAACHRIWRRDLEAGRSPRTANEREIPPFSMPAGWTPDDLRHREGR